MLSYNAGFVWTRMCNSPESTTSLFIASVFAENMGFIAEDLTTNNSVNIFSQWLKGNCQPNYRKVRVCVLGCVFFSLLLAKGMLLQKD